MIAYELKNIATLNPKGTDHQAQIQRLREVSQTDKIPEFLLADVWVSKYTSVITCIALSTLVHWLGARQCKII